MIDIEEAMVMIRLKRIYEEASADDGKRVLVDRVWPRGVSKEEARLDEWMRAVAPSPDLRKWFGHDPERFDEFKEAYEKELSESAERQEAVEQLRDWSEEGTVTLLYAAKDETHNHVVVLKAFLE
ncbi:MAG TPA: DUF488 domain-containing protein [Bacillales bacterium]|nr:DUF488 domain-containing protein [Bacillales bacterium]